MRLLLQALVITSMLCGLAACGNKGKLKSPSQIEREEAKKAKKAAKEKDDSSPSPLEGEGGEEGNSPQTQPANVQNQPLLPNPPPPEGRE